MATKIVDNRVNFASVHNPYPYPDFLDVQIKSFKDFLQLDTPLSQNLFSESIFYLLSIYILSKFFMRIKKRPLERGTGDVLWEINFSAFGSGICVDNRDTMRIHVFVVIASVFE